MALSDDILGADDVEVEPVDVPEWGVKVYVRGLTGEERDLYEASLRQFRQRFDGKGQEMVLVQDNARAKLLVKCLVGEDRQRIFTDQQAPALGKKNGKVLDRLYEVAARLSGLSDEVQEELEGNSDAATASGDSTSS